MEKTIEQKRAESVERLKEVYEAYGLGYAIEVQTLEASDLPDEEIAGLVKQAGDALQKLKYLAGY